MSGSGRKRIALLALLGVSATALVAVSAVEPATALVASGYSDPIWWPLREPVATNCATSNCTVNGQPYHGFHAIDWTDGDRYTESPTHDPIYAAGSGIFHIRQIDPGCQVAGDVGTQGTWVWIDHGAGVSSVYAHLDSVTAVEGQWVDPTTQIGTMGNSGSGCKDGPTFYYLHFEIRHEGYFGGVRQLIPPLQACNNRQVLTYPDDLRGTSATAWNDIMISDRVTVPVTDSSCIPASFMTPGMPQGVGASVGPTSITTTWSAPPAGVTQTVVEQQVWILSLNRWSNPVYETVDPTASSHRLSGLTEGRRYRVRVAFRGAEGSSNWSSWLYRVPGEVPDTPTTRYVNEYQASISYGWKTTSPGYPVVEYQVAIRRRYASTWGRWSYSRVTSTYRRYDGLVSGATYQFKARARNELGWSAWSVPASGVPT